MTTTEFVWGEAQIVEIRADGMVRVDNMGREHWLGPSDVHVPICLGITGMLVCRMTGTTSVYLLLVDEDRYGKLWGPRV